jgi:general secretion pathway protein J
MKARGFTLVEVLVAMMIMAILAVMAWQGVDGIVRARSISQARLEQTLRLNTVLGQLEQDLQAVQSTKVVPSVAFDGSTLRITRRAETGVQLVTWSLKPKPDATGNRWLRWAGPPARTSNELQELWLRTFQFQGAEAGQLETLPGIVQWQLYCYRGNSWSNCQSTGNVATTTSPASPASAAVPVSSAASAPVPIPAQVFELQPSALRVVLEFAGDVNGTLTRDIALGPQWP